jgi:hypothetical protein
MTSHQYDAIIIGGGHNGLVAAYSLLFGRGQGEGESPAKVVKLPFYEPEWKKR